MMWLIAGLGVLYLALLITIYFVPLRRAARHSPDPPSSPAAVPKPEAGDEASEVEAETETQEPIGAGH